MRSLQPPDILLIYWRVYNSIVNTSKGVLFLPPSDAYVTRFLYLLYTLIKLYYTKALSNQASSLAPDWILLRGPRIPASWFNNNLSVLTGHLIIKQVLFTLRENNGIVIKILKRLIILIYTEMFMPEIIHIWKMKASASE